MEAVGLGEQYLVDYVERLIASARLQDAIENIQQDEVRLGVEFGPMWKHSPKHE
jgi:hypothetical protein